MDDPSLDTDAARAAARRPWSGYTIWCPRPMMDQSTVLAGHYDRTGWPFPSQDRTLCFWLGADGDDHGR